MTQIQTDAIRKLTEARVKTFQNKRDFLVSFLRSTLCSFCEQSEEFAAAGLDKTVWQYFTVVPDFKSVGVRNNARSYDWPVIIRAVNTVDAMTATIEEIDWAVLKKITDRILKEVPNVNRVCYDMSPKPSATIEWE